MITDWIGQVTGSLEQKKRYRHYKVRTQQLPDDYRAAVDALDRYLLCSGLISKGEVLMSMLEDLADLFEQSAANATPVRAIVGEDPVEFAEAFLRNYSQARWNDKERRRLTNAIDRVAGNDRDRRGNGSPPSAGAGDA